LHQRFSALDSAIHRPQSGYYNDIIEEAAALFESLLINHPFVDDNKRVAFAAVDVFLRINSFKINSSSDKIYNHLISLFESGQCNFKSLEIFLRTNVIK
jgi:death-on-curing protein